MVLAGEIRKSLQNFLIPPGAGSGVNSNCALVVSLPEIFQQEEKEVPFWPPPGFGAPDAQPQSHIEASERSAIPSAEFVVATHIWMAACYAAPF